MSVAKHLGRLGRETVVYGLAGAINRSISILLIPLYTRVFTTEEYGIVGVIITLVALAQVLVSGLDNAAARWFFEYEGDDRKQVIASWFSFQVIVGLVVVTATILFASFLSEVLLDSQSYAVLIYLAIAGMFVGLFGKMVTYLYRFQQKPWHLMIFTAARSLLIIGVIIAFVVGMKWGLIGLYAAQLVVSSVVAICVVVVYGQWLSPRKISRKVFREMFFFGLPVIPAAFGSWLAVSSDRLVMIAVLDMSSIGIYTVALSIASLVAFLDYAFQMAWGPFAFSIMDKPDALEVYKRVLNAYVLVGCAACTALSVFSPLILALFTTPQYFGAASCIPFLAFSFLAIGFRDAVGIGANLAKNSRPLAISLLIGAGAAPLLTIVLTPVWGKEGAAAAKMLAFVAPAIYMFLASQKLYRIPYQVRVILTCVFYSWGVIAIDQLLLGSTAFIVLVIKSLIILSFLPFAVVIGIVQPQEVRKAIMLFGRRIRRKWESGASST